MVDVLVRVLVSFAAMATAAVGGCFLAFSDFLMVSLAEVGEPCGSSVMKQINVNVYGSVILTLFVLLAPVSLAFVGFAICSGHRRRHGRQSIILWLLLACVVYCGGCFAVTGLENIPLNDHLAQTQGHGTAKFWRHTFLPKWTAYNTARAVACFVASACYFVAFALLGDKVEYDHEQSSTQLLPTTG